MENKYFYVGLVVIVLAVVGAAVGMSWNKAATGEAVSGAPCSYYLTTNVAANVYKMEGSNPVYRYTTVASNGRKYGSQCGTFNYNITDTDNSPYQGYREYLGTVTLVAGQTSRIEVNLVPY